MVLYSRVASDPSAELAFGKGRNDERVLHAGMGYLPTPFMIHCRCHVVFLAADSSPSITHAHLAQQLATNDHSRSHEMSEVTLQPGTAALSRPVCPAAAALAQQAAAIAAAVVALLL